MQGGGSFRIGNSSIWRHSDANIFSISFHQEDDEEDLKWAAIQKLPTVARLRKALLTSSEGEEDNEKFLLKLKERIDRVGIDLPTIEVRFENSNIEAESHVGTRALPTFTNFMIHIVEGLLNSLRILQSRRQHINILQDVSGIINPGRMTLLLGPPISGKTTLLLALAAKLDPKLKFSGKVTYNGHGMDEFVPQKTAAYANQNDLHVAELTVRETLAFSARVQGVGTHYDLLAELSRREKETNIKLNQDIDVYMKALANEGQKANLMTDYVLRILGLEVCADTIVGNAMLRGISGGQRKHVTTGEMLVGPANALFMDEISTGLDSSTTYQILNSLKQCVHILKGIAVISLLQPAPETYNLFYDIILLSDSHIVYQGPREYVLQFFESIGFKCPERKAVADFLQEVTSSKDQEQYWADKDQPYRSAKEFSEAYKSFHVGRSLAVGREMTVALTLGSFILASLVAMSGFVLSKDNIKKWWLWGFWISPMMYGQNAMVNNEFLGMRWRHVLPNSKEPLGVEVLKSRGFFTQSYWYWIAVGALIGYTLLFNFGYILALMYLSRDSLQLKSPGKHRAVISEEPQSNEQNGGSNKGMRNSESGSTSSQTFPARQRGMVLPFEPYSITFDEVTYAVDMPQEMRNRGVAEENLVLLKGVRGTFRSGVLTALMGITGTGKTTLMDVLAGRKTGGYVGGNIKISGYRKKQETFARISGYCEQNDIHSPHVTVYESLLYSSWLRLSPDINVETRKIFIEEVMQLVELKPLRHALVGLPGVNGISTEQRKRLTIAVELVENPSIIFMDEPTSGLDARAAAVVMRTVRNTVDTGRTVVCTIHQPSIDIFESFDEGIKGVSKIKDGYNPATWMLEVTTSAKEIELGIDFAEHRNRIFSDIVFGNCLRRNKALVKELSSAAPGSVELYFPSQYSTSFFTQCMACLWKQHWSYWRNSQYTAVRFLFSTSIAVLFGSMFWNLGSKIEKKQDLFNAIGSMYAAVLLIGVKNASSVQPVVAVERTVFYRERAAGMYSALPYAFAQASNFTF
ncbi:hypothetical protein JHK85_007940 [Glycine max]|nr:hypothetical protein JHK85_007940 [Glycine max]